MTKKELLKYNPPFKMIVDLYDDEEEIPKELIKVLYYTPKPQPIIMLMSEKNGELFNKIMKEHYDSNL